MAWIAAALINVHFAVCACKFKEKHKQKALNIECRNTSYGVKLLRNIYFTSQPKIHRLIVKTHKVVCPLTITQFIQK